MSPNDSQTPPTEGAPSTQQPAARREQTAESLKFEDLLNEPIEFTLSDWADLPMPSLH